MKISTKGQYAVRLMVEVAKSKTLVSIANIAKAQNISNKYLEHANVLSAYKTKHLPDAK